MNNPLRRATASLALLALSLIMLATLLEIFLDGVAYIGEPILWIRLVEIIGMILIMAFAVYNLFCEAKN